MNINEIIERLRFGSLFRGRHDVDADLSEAQDLGWSIEDPKKRQTFILIASFIAAAAAEGVIGNRSDDALRQVYTSVFPDLTIRPEFVTFAHRERMKPDLLIAVGRELGEITPTETACVRALSALNVGGLIHLADYQHLSNAADHHEQGQTAAFIRTLLAAHLVRIGCTEQATRLIAPLEIGQLPSPYKLLLIEQTLSSNYVGLSSAHALDTSRWRFDDALRTFREIAGEFEISIIDGPRAKVVLPDRISPQGVEAVASYSVRGFYILFFSMLYAAAEETGDNLPHIGDLIWRTLRDFAPKFERAVWNSGFIAALQFHRQGAFEQRDRLLGICLGDPAFWGSIIPADRWGCGLRGTDVIPIMAAHFMRTTRGLIGRFSAEDRVPRRDRLLSLAPQMAPSSGLQSIDVIRKVSQEDLSPGGMLLRHGVHQGGLGIYHEPAKTVRAGLLVQ